MKRLRHDKRAVSNALVVMLSLVLVVIVVANVVLWSYQMNQLDWEKMQEKITLTGAERVTSSPWSTSQAEYLVNVGSRLNGTYVDTQAVDANYETFTEGTSPVSYNPAGYTLGGSTKYVSGSTADLTTNNGVYMVFRSYSSRFSSQTSYAHTEVVTIAGTPYYQLKLNTADSSGTTFQADASTTGRKLLARFVYPLINVTSIPASTWTIYYRAYRTGLFTQIHCDTDLLIRRSDGTIRTTLASDIATSPNLNRDTYTTVSATYAWANYAVVNDTDFLEADFYAHVTSSQSGRNAYLRVDDSSLPTSDQTRIAGVMLPDQYTVQTELTGSSDTSAWQSLTWIIDSAFTIGNVNTTLQLYNYSASQYPTSGDGYIAYNSSATPNTDETASQTITANPTFFRGPAGEWRAKIVGVRDTTWPFDLRVDWTALRVVSPTNYRLDFTGEVALDVSTYIPAYVRSIEIQIRYRANDSIENWYIKAYNWTGAGYSDAGFNSTAGDTPSTGFKYYAVNLTSAWQSYVQNGTLRIEFCDNNPDADASSIDVDFLGARFAVDAVEFSFENDSPLTSHVVGIWVINATMHTRYDANFFLNSGASGIYLRPDIFLPTSNFTIRVVTERGNTVVYRNG
jgi:hypothetical protein